MASKKAGIAKEQEKPTKETQQQDYERRKETATFSVKIDSQVLKKWRYYTSVAESYGKKGKLTENAIVEYMNRHKLTPEQQEKIDLLCQLDL